MSSPEQARVGSVLDQKWTLERLLGAGAMGSVYEARHRNGARAAVKLLHPMLAREPEVRERFLREGYAANKVEHKGCVRVLDDDVVESGPDAGTAYLVMELLDGESLDDRQRRTPQLGEHELLVVAEQVLEVLAVAHSAGVVHRDLKPENLFLAKDDDRVRVKVLDFGLARVSDAGLATNAGRALGTPAFMSPEQASGRVDEIDGRTDLFALGATLFRVLSGRRVHEGDNAIQVLVQMQREPAPKLAEVFPEVSPAFAKIVDRALSFLKDDRYPVAADMLADVKAARESLGLAGPVSLLATTPQRGTAGAPESLLSQDVIAVVSSHGDVPVKGAVAFANTMVAMPSPLLKERPSASVDVVPPTVDVEMRPPTASELEPFPPPSPPSELALSDAAPSARVLPEAVPVSPKPSEVASSFATDETALPSTNVPAPTGLTPTDVAPPVAPLASAASPAAPLASAASPAAPLALPVAALASTAPVVSTAPVASTAPLAEADRAPSFVPPLALEVPASSPPAQSVAAPDAGAAPAVHAIDAAPGTFPAPGAARGDAVGGSMMEASAVSEAEPSTLAPGSEAGDRVTMELRGGAPPAPTEAAASAAAVEAAAVEAADADANRETSELPPEPRMEASMFEVVAKPPADDTNEPLDALPTTRISWVPIAGGVALLALVAVGYLASRGETRSTATDAPADTPAASTEAPKAEPSTALELGANAPTPPTPSSEPTVATADPPPPEHKAAEETTLKPPAHPPKKPTHPTLGKPAVPHAGGKPHKPPHPHPKK